VMADLYHIAYMDETGHAADDAQMFCGMAGLLAPAYKWKVFEDNWNAVLKEFGIPYFHMKEFAHSEGVFEGWKGNETKRRDLFNKLLNKIAAIRAVPVGSITSLDAYRNLTPEDQVVHHDPYLRSLMDCSGLPGFVLQNQPSKVKFAVVFSQQAEFSHRAKRVYQMISQYFSFGQRMMYPDFKDMRDLVPLQAADIIAYELHREFERRLYYPDEKARYGYTRIEEMAKRVLPPNFLPFVFHDEKAVNNFVSRMKARLAELGMDSPKYAEAWRWLYSQRIKDKQTK